MPVRAISSYTPKHLSDKILQTRSAIEGELKQVTVLFADIKGSMALAGQLDPETWHRLLDRFFDLLTQGVHRYEGTVNQYTGDGIMALFGAPIAHEDHAQRACYAAIHLREALKDYADTVRIEYGVPFSARIGINSGEVVVGKIGDDLRMDYTAQGHTVGLAQRIEQLADPGRAYLSDRTHRLVKGYFECRSLGSTVITGAEDRVEIFELMETSGSGTRLQVSRARGLSHFVGREQEMSTLESALEHAQAGHGQVVGVVGDPGLGKSRLCYEFVERCKARGLGIFEAYCPAHGKNIPFIPILQLYRSYFAVREQDPPALARQKIAGALVLLDPELQEGLPALFEFMGVADPDEPAPLVDPEVKQRQLYAMLHKSYRAQADKGIGIVVLIDDLHWIDPGSDTFLTQMVSATEGSRNVLLLNFRPEYRAQWMQRAYYHQLPLVPLGSESTIELVESLIGRDESLGDLASRVVDWTSGNPFFIEEVMQELVEGGHLEGVPGAYRLVTDVDALEVPTNVRALLASRIDRLDEPAKQLLQTAAIIGKEFSEPMLKAAADVGATEYAPALEKLKSGDFIFERAIYPVIEFAFKHPLTHEVAYDSQLQSRRTRAHAAVATAIEQIEAKKLDENAALIAYHWEAAGNPDEAIKWHQRAAEWLGASDPPGTFRHWQLVHELLADMPRTDANIALNSLACAQCLTAGWRGGASEHEAEAYFKEGRADAATAGDQQLLCLINAGYSAFRGIGLGYADDYCKYAKEAARIAESTGNPELIYGVGIFHVFGHVFGGHFGEALKVARAMLELEGSDTAYGANFGNQSPLITYHYGVAISSYLLGDVETARRHYLILNQLAVASGWYEMRIMSDAFCAHFFADIGDAENAMRHARMAMEIAASNGTTAFQILSHFALGASQLAAGEASAAIETLTDTLSMSDQKNTLGYMKSCIFGRLAEALFHHGKLEVSAAISDQGVTYCTERELRWDLRPWLMQARCAIALGDESGSRELLVQCEGLISDINGVAFQPILHEARAEYAAAFASEWSAEEELRSAQREYESLDADAHVRRIATILKATPLQ